MLARTMDERRRRFEAQALPHLDAAYNLARWLARSSSDADDIVQEAMLRAYKGIDGFHGTEIRPWLLAIVRNCYLTAARRNPKSRHVPLPEEGEVGPVLVSDELDPETAVIRADERQTLDAVIAALPEEFREVLVLREIEDCSYREIAEITGAPIGTVMSRLSRARSLVKERYRGLR